MTSQISNQSVPLTADELARLEPYMSEVLILADEYVSGNVTVTTLHSYRLLGNIRELEQRPSQIAKKREQTLREVIHITECFPGILPLFDYYQKKITAIPREQLSSFDWNNTQPSQVTFCRPFQYCFYDLAGELVVNRYSGVTGINPNSYDYYDRLTPSHYLSKTNLRVKSKEPQNILANKIAADYKRAKICKTIKEARELVCEQYNAHQSSFGDICRQSAMDTYRRRYEAEIRMVKRVFPMQNQDCLGLIFEYAYGELGSAIYDI